MSPNRLRLTALFAALACTIWCAVVTVALPDTRIADGPVRMLIALPPIVLLLSTMTRWGGGLRGYASALTVTFALVQTFLVPFTDLPTRTKIVESASFLLIAVLSGAFGVVQAVLAGATEAAARDVRN